MVARPSDQAAVGWAWLDDDTEESVVGTPLHQKAISMLADLLEDLRDDESASWDVGRGLGVRGFLRRDGTIYTPIPDVQVHPRPLPRDIAEISLAAYGPPHLVVEVASQSTIDADVGEKARTYARGGVREYLVFDVSGRLVPEGTVWARTLRPDGLGTLEPWLPEDDGRWHSALGFALAPEGALLRVYTRQGTALALPSEERRRRHEAEHARWEAEQERALVEQALVEAERRRHAAEERVAALEAELHRLHGPDDRPS